jgi:hypothetical protein
MKTTPRPQQEIPPPQPCFAPCPICGHGQVLVRTYDMQTHTYRLLPLPLTPLMGQAYRCEVGVHTIATA